MLFGAERQGGVTLVHTWPGTRGWLALTWFCVCLLAIGIVGCGLVSTGEPSTQPQAIRVSPQPTPAQLNAFSFEEVIALLEEEERRPLFFGDFAGLTFQENIGAAELGCSGLMTDVPWTDLGESPLHMELTYLPQDYTKVSEAAYACDIGIASHAWQYSDRAGGELTVNRYTSRITRALAPAERMTEIQVGGRTAILITRVPIPGQPKAVDLGPYDLLLVEEFGHTTISTRNIPLDELVKIADGLR